LTQANGKKRNIQHFRHLCATAQENQAFLKFYYLRHPAAPPHYLCVERKSGIYYGH
jgi:hypothetical protein